MFHALVDEVSCTHKKQGEMEVACVAAMAFTLMA
jgi:hypothetical protein